MCAILNKKLMSGFYDKWKKLALLGCIRSLPLPWKRPTLQKPTSQINFCGIVYYLCQVWAQQLLAFKCDTMQKCRYSDLPKLCSATLKLKLMVSITDNTVFLVTYYVVMMTMTCSTITGLFLVPLS